MKELKTPVTDYDYQRIANQALNNQLALIDEFDSWEEIYRDQSLTIEQKSVSLGNLIRSTMTLVNVDYDQLKKLVHNPSFEQKKQLVEEIYYSKEIKEGNYLVEHTKYQTPIGITNREFVCLKAHSTLEDESFLSVMTSINYANIPGTPDLVRGVLHSGTLITDLGFDRVRITIVDYVDPKGWIPTFIVNSYKMKAGNRLKKIQQICGK